MVQVAGRVVWGNMGANEPGFMVLDLDVGFPQAYLAGAYRLDFRAQQYEAGFKVFFQEVVVGRLAVPGDNPVVFGHSDRLIHVLSDPLDGGQESRILTTGVGLNLNIRQESSPVQRNALWREPAGGCDVQA